jgi:hypothetical protein
MLFNQQQCFIYSTASFLSKLRAKKVENPIYIFTSPSGIQLIISASPNVEITSPGRRARGFFNPRLRLENNDISEKNVLDIIHSIKTSVVDQIFKRWRNRILFTSLTLAIFLCLSQAKPLISNTIYVIIFFMLNDLRGEVIV